ncbi:uncharacterized protein LOC123904157 [Trifolium pratense]|uniref:uncharacterized protein LOC123904157 n=1 Tax=Trifolium pratense TaxID=57577 RepID=UPI001E693712|nr:uncharacterized protein LOC123904157 [Trifolium pratense]
MGVCASYPDRKITDKTTKDGNAEGGVNFQPESFRRPSSIMVMNISTGAIKEYKQPIRANVVVSENSDNKNCYYLSNAESMCIGTCMPRVPDEEELLLGRIYFIVPLSYSDFPLSVSFLCDLAVKVSSALDHLHQ